MTIKSLMERGSAHIEPVSDSDEDYELPHIPSTTPDIPNAREEQDIPPEAYPYLLPILLFLFALFFLLSRPDMDWDYTMSPFTFNFALRFCAQRIGE